jgi:hypothetical protein
MLAHAPGMHLGPFQCCHVLRSLFLSIQAKLSAVSLDRRSQPDHIPTRAKAGPLPPFPSSLETDHFCERTDDKYDTK